MHLGRIQRHWNRQRGQCRRILALLLGQAHHDVETPVALEHLADRGAAHGHRHGVLQCANRQAVARQRGAVGRDRHQWQPGDLFELDVGGARDGAGQFLDLATDLRQPFQVVPVQLHRDLGAHPGDQFVHAHLYRLGEFVVVAGDRAHRGFEFADQLGFGLARIRPLAPVLDHDEGVGHRRRHRIGGDLGGPDLGNHFLDLGELLDARFQLLLHAHRLGKTGARNAQRMQRDVALVEIGDELAAEPGGQEADQHGQHHSASDHQLAPAQRFAEQRCVAAADAAHHRCFLLRYLPGDEQRHRSRHERE